MIYVVPQSTTVKMHVYRTHVYIRFLPVTFIWFFIPNGLKVHVVTMQLVILYVIISVFVSHFTQFHSKSNRVNITPFWWYEMS